MGILGFFLIVGSFVIPAYQAYLWLTGGSWTPLSTDVLFSKILPSSFYVWLADDTSWIGLKEIVSRIVSDMSLFGFTFWSGSILILFDPSHKSYLRQTKAKTDDNWDGRQAVREQIKKVDDLRDLYKKLGYSPYVEEESKKMLDKLQSLIHVEIVGMTKSRFGEFQKDLTNLEQRFANNTQEKIKLTSWARNYFDKLFKNKENYQKVIELLNKSWFWKKHLSDYGMAKKDEAHLTDRNKFLALLDELEKMFSRPWVPQNKGYEDILSCIKQVREDVNKAEDFLSADVLHSLESAIEETCVMLSHDEAAEEKKRKIDDLLSDLAYAKHTHETRDSYLLDVAKEQAKIYLDSDWMHNSWLKTHILSYLLEGEIALRQTAPISEKFFLATIIGCFALAYFKLIFYASLWFAIFVACFFNKSWADFKIRGLQVVRGEILSGAYDSEELARRLRKLEKRGVQVQSIVYGLLREKPEIDKHLANDKAEGRGES